jgi:galactokinase
MNSSFDERELVAAFIRRFSALPRLFSAPGRVNLIGEHTDYNDGFVLPMAVESRTYVAARARDDGRVHVYSETFADAFEFDLDSRIRPGRRGWGDYVEGTARTLSARGFSLRGADLLITSSVPPGAGLSASAALEVAVGFALLRLSGVSDPGRLTLALAAQAAEHEYVGTLCGIMDQYICALAEPESALLIDCRSLESRTVPLALGERRIVICDTRVRHELASSEYNVRRAECERGAALLASLAPGIRSLRDVSGMLLAEHSPALSEVTLKRCRHVVSENTRTLTAAQALENGDFLRFGALMSASHASLRDDYEVSCAELDFAVESALSVPGVYGSRMTGGGFGGCTVTLVDESSIPSLIDRIGEGFRREYGTEVTLFATTAGGGVREHVL